jgi:hypothetical protein
VARDPWVIGEVSQGLRDFVHLGWVVLAAVITPAERSARTATGSSHHAFTPSSTSRAVTSTAAPARARGAVCRRPGTSTESSESPEVAHAAKLIPNDVSRKPTMYSNAFSGTRASCPTALGPESRSRS